MYDDLPPACQAAQAASNAHAAFDLAHERELLRAEFARRDNGFGFHAAWMPRDPSRVSVARRARALGAMCERDPRFAARCRARWERYQPLAMELARLQAVQAEAWTVWEREFQANRARTARGV